MKITIVSLLCVIYCALVHADTVAILCSQKAGFDLSDLKSMYESNSEEQMKKLGCFEACVFQKLHFMDGNTLNVEKLESGTRELTPDDFTEDVHEIIEQCVSKAADEDECMVARKYIDCALEKMKFLDDELEKIAGN
ncbi:odorant binding protein 4 precursor [Apis mellifera carnica]|uniref:Odorant binding protein 4 precursor n=1 Tax=Apis mellifera TaxID=7460 RepID=A0A7M6UQF8_APIME|nr:odorant binding protein 4 precursor [Apis mellifera]AAL60420.1 odorant binding protein ASP4 [Apis mellifera]KAG9430899.1 odorant binding protein 4 precursor [Apis mellifera carnica]|eukprot:NP_001011589.1 odorant binding protein 4 precursor [Apis mellifera]